MEALLILYVIYMFAATIATIVGFFWLLINAINKVPYKKALKVFLIGIIMFVIGFGTCYAMVNGGSF